MLPWRLILRLESRIICSSRVNPINRFECIDSEASSSFWLELWPAPAPVGSGSKLRLHRGQVEFDSNHVSMHSRWNACLHFGSNRRRSSSANSVKQTAQSALSFNPRMDPYENTGSVSMNACSTPASWRWKRCCSWPWSALTSGL